MATWRNWSGTVVADIDVATPSTVGELQEIVAHNTRTGRRVKPIGAGHSFTPIGATDGVQLRLDRMQGIVRADRESGLVTVLGATRLHELNEALWQLDLGLANLGDIDVQTVAGAISTGTHGTGARLGGLATQVHGMQLVCAGGSLLDVDTESRPAAVIGLGALGVIATVTLHCVPRFALAAAEAPADLDDVLADLDENIDGNDHFEFYWFPHTRRVLTKRNNRVLPQTELRPVGRLRQWVDDDFLSNTVFVFREMEYAVPRENVAHVLAEVDSWLRRSDERIGFPVEVRFAAADDLWLSTAYGRESGYIAVRQYHRRDHSRYFRAVEEIAISVGGRPHWGKLHERDADSLRSVYPRFDDFVAFRDRLDPNRVFGNAYLEQILGS